MEKSTYFSQIGGKICIPPFPFFFGGGGSNRKIYTPEHVHHGKYFVFAGHNLREVAEFAVPPPLETETGDRPPPLETETGDCPPPLETVTEDYPPVSGSAYEEHGGQFGPQTDLIALGALQERTNKSFLSSLF